MKASTFNHQRENKPNILDHLRTIGLLAKWPLIGVALFLVGGLIFGAFAFNVVSNGPLIQADNTAANQVYAFDKSIPKIWINIFIFGSFLGREMVIMIGLALGLYFFYKRFWREFTMVVVGFLGEEALFESLSRLFHRHRPIFNPPVWEVLPGPGFPSGHTASAIVCYGLLAYLFIPKIKSRFWKAVVLVVTLLIIIFIGIGRIFVLDHYLTDVLAGYGMGLAWAGLAYTVIEKIFQRRTQKETGGT